MQYQALNFFFGWVKKKVKPKTDAVSYYDCAHIWHMRKMRFQMSVEHLSVAVLGGDLR